MIKTILIAVLLFLAVTFLVRKVFIGLYKTSYSNKERSLWSSRMYFWHFIFMISGALTLLLIYVLKWANVISF